MTFCVNCGSQVDGRFCAKCGTPVAPSAAPGARSTPPPGSAALGMEENLAAALAYIPVLNVIFLAVDPYKLNRNLRFHAWQSVIAMAGLFACRFALGLLRGASGYGLWPLFALLSTVVSVAYLGLIVVMAVKAYQNGRFVAPFITELAEKQAGPMK